MHEQSRALLGGDVVGRRATRRARRRSTRCSTRCAARGIAIATSTNFASMALVPRTGGTRLVQVHAVSAGLSVLRQDHHGAGGGVGAAAARDTTSLVDPSLLVSLDAQIGDTLTLGFAKFVITGTLVSVPGDVGITRGDRPARLHPRALRRRDGAAVVRQPRRVRDAVQAARRRSRRRVHLRASRSGCRAGATARCGAAGYNESRLTSAIDQLHDFLGVVGLVALLLGGIGVASGVHAFVMRKIDTVAILRCLGATSWQVLAIYALQAAVMGLIGAAAGVVLGVGIQFADAASCCKDFLPVDVERASRAVGDSARTWRSACGSRCCSRCVRSSRCATCRPLQALRREPDADALRRARWDPLRITLSLAIARERAGARPRARANTVQRGLGFTVAIAGGDRRPVAQRRRRCRGLARRVAASVVAVRVRQGIASLYRPGNQTRAVVLALGFGVFLMGTLYQVQHNILRSLELTPRRGARERRVLRRAGRPEAGDRLDHPRRRVRDDRRDADRRRCDRVDQRHVRRATSSPRSRRSRDAAARARRAARGRDDPGASVAGRGRCAASSARRSATR